MFLKRNSLEVSINPYNETTIKLLESNTDLQSILDPYAAACYMVNYITKQDGGLNKLVQQASDNTDDRNFDVKEKLFIIANTFNSAHAISSQEAVYIALSLPLS